MGFNSGFKGLNLVGKAPRLISYDIVCTTEQAWVLWRREKWLTPTWNRKHFLGIADCRL